MAPDEMVTVVAANITWNRKKIQTELELTKSEFTEKFPKPIKPPCDQPNIRPKPIKKKPMAPADISQAFFITMLMAFLEREKPISRRQKPACIRKTNAADTRRKT